MVDIYKFRLQVQKEHRRIISSAYVCVLLIKHFLP